MATGAYAALVEKVDAFASSAHDGQAEFLRCGYGCDGCCRVRRSATRIEIAHIQAHLSGYPADQRAALGRRRARLDATGKRAVSSSMTTEAAPFTPHAHSSAAPMARRSDSPMESWRGVR